MPYYDASGNELVDSAVGNVQASSALNEKAAAITALGAPRIQGKIIIRRKVQIIQVGSVAANTVTAAGVILGQPIMVAEAAELLALATLVGGTGTPVAPQLFLQVLEPVNGVWITLPNGTAALSTTVTGTAALGLVQCTNFGDMVRVGVLASTAWTGGTIYAYLKIKG